MTMRFDEERDNVVETERMLAEADQRAEVAEAAPAKIIPVIVTVDELPPSDYPKPYNPQHVVDGVVVEDVDDDDDDYDYEDDGQPDEYSEWQDYMGGDDWDHGQYDDCGW